MYLSSAFWSENKASGNPAKAREREKYFPPSPGKEINFCRKFSIYFFSSCFNFSLAAVTAG
jgi:hypothetical protein